MRSLIHLHVPDIVFEATIMWEQPTHSQYAFAMPTIVVEVSSSEEDLEEDLEKDPEDNLEEEEPIVPRPTPVELEPDPEAEPAPVLVAEPDDERGPGWLVESEESSSHEWMLEWMAAPYIHLYQRSLTA